MRWWLQQQQQQQIDRSTPDIYPHDDDGSDGGDGARWRRRFHDSRPYILPVAVIRLLLLVSSVHQIGQPNCCRPVRACLLARRNRTDRGGSDGFALIHPGIHACVCVCGEAGVPPTTETTKKQGPLRYSLSLCRLYTHTHIRSHYGMCCGCVLKIRAMNNK